MARRELKDRVVVVTGAAGGLGRALCHAFGERGARIALLDVDAAAVENTANALRDRGVEAIALACDVTSREACEGAIAAVAEHFAAIDILVNNAGITHRSAFGDTDSAVYRRVMEVNYFGALHCTKAALPWLRARRGQIIAISSVAGFAPLLGRTGYAAAKHAMIGLFSSLRAELRSEGITVLTVTPSFIRTDIDKNALDADGQKTRHPQSTFGKVISPDAAAATIVRAAERNKERLSLGTVAKVARLLSALAPRLYEWLMTRSLGSELRRK